MKIVFFGTHEFAAAILQGLVNSPDLEIGMVVTQPDKPVGRGQKIQKPPVKILAEKYGLKVEQPKSLKSPTFNIQYSMFDLGICAQYGLLIPPRILKTIKHGVLNVHPSLLPKYRGASPIQSAILNEEKKTGVTIMKLDEGLDTGPILTQKSLKIGPNDIYPTLELKMAEIAKGLLLEVIPRYLSGRLKPRTQDNSQAVDCRPLTREDGRINWRKSAREIYNQWRALQPWPGVWEEFKILNSNFRIKMIKIEFSEETSAFTGDVGNLVKISKNRLGIVCGDKKIIEVIKLQPEGKKVMTAEEFRNGYLR